MDDEQLQRLIRLIALAIVASLPVPLHAQRPDVTEKITKSFKVGPSGTLDISNVSGDVIVNEGGTDTIVIDAVKKIPRARRRREGPVRACHDRDGGARRVASM